MSFNFTHPDIDHSRGFAIVTKKKKLVAEALKLLAADNDRSTYEAGMDDFVVSPVNARKQLLALIHRARKHLLIYDPNIADAEMLRALDTRARHGVSVRIIGSVGRKSPRLNVRPLGGFRLHTRAIIRDGCEGFVGSQSLRRPSSIRGAKSASSSATRRSSPVSSIRSKLTGRRKKPSRAQPRCKPRVTRSRGISRRT